MKVLQITTKSTIGGVQVHVSQLVEFLLQNKVEVAVMAYPGGWLEEKVGLLDTKFIPNPHFSNNILNIGELLKAKAVVVKAVDEFKPDLVACHSSVAGFITRLAVGKKVPVVFTAHGWSFTPGNPAWRRLIGFLAERLVLPRTAKVICVSDYDLQLAKHAGFKPAEKLIVIPNGIEVGDTALLENKFHTARAQIVFVGRLDKQKAPEQLIRAFAQLPSEVRTKADVVIAGGGPKMPLLAGLVSRFGLQAQVKPLGDLPRERIWQLLRASQIFVLPSNWEGLPLTILEAMASNMAVIASDVGGVKEAIGGGAGVLIKRGDERALREALENLITHPAEAEKLARIAFDKVRREFPLEKMLADTLQVYRSVLK